jgi:hypothetical protein
VTHRGRYSQRDRLNRQELAAIREREQMERDLIAHGHDKQAASRARQLDFVQRNMDDMEKVLSGELLEQARQITEKKVAEIRASGPVGCSCGYWRCIESQPSEGES